MLPIGPAVKVTIYLNRDTAADQGLRLSREQTDQMTRHAICYKLLAQLLLEQLQAQIKDNRLVRADLAQQLQQKIAWFLTDSHQVLYLLWPYFVACTELKDPTEQEQVLGRMRYLGGGIATQSCNCMDKFLQLVWATTAIDPAVTWLELVEIGSEFSIGP